MSNGTSIEERKKAVATTLGKVSELIKECPNFDGFDFDWCQEHCPLYKICDDVSTVQDPSQIAPKNFKERVFKFIKDILNWRPNL